jgi:lipopolysaccharide transport system ATP-binding protein
MSEVMIQVEHLSKQYRLGELSTGALAHDLNRWWARARGKPDPYLKVTRTNIRNQRSASVLPGAESDYVWALRDIGFEVKRGEVLGIIGRNGAGKSTLLKILSRVTAPTEGEIRIDGRIAALLEVGTGFHPDLTGRENIYLNGAILGMTRAEIRGKIEEIIEFSGCERYIDTPVKRYSSGMVVRLGFAVAAHLEPEILIVDEVLAVGDAEYQKKCIAKMQDVAGHGRTILFVSHNMGAVRRLCSRAILLVDGEIKETGSTEEIVSHYTAEVAREAEAFALGQAPEREGDQSVRFTEFVVRHGGRNGIGVAGEPLDLVFTIQAAKRCDQIDLGFSIHDEYDGMLSVLYSGYQSRTFSMEAGETKQVVFAWDPVSLAPGNYFIRGRILANGGLVADRPLLPLGLLRVEAGDFYGTGSMGFPGKTAFLLKGKWEMS